MEERRARARQPSDDHRRRHSALRARAHLLVRREKGRELNAPLQPLAHVEREQRAPERRERVSLAIDAVELQRARRTLPDAADCSER